MDDRIEGKAKQTEGKLQEAWGDAKEKTRDAWEDAEDKLVELMDEGDQDAERERAANRER